MTGLGFLEQFAAGSNCISHCGRIGQPGVSGLGSPRAIALRPCGPQLGYDTAAKKEAWMTALKTRYSSVAIAFHWTIAALILTNIGLAWYFGTLTGEAKLEPVQLHKSIGITVLILSLGRLGWRLAVPPPKLPDYVHGWEKGLAQTVHVGFYVIMLGMPLSGWALTSASPLIKVFPITLYHLIPWPAIAPLANLPHDQMKQAHTIFVKTHGLLAWLAYGLVFLHVAGALKHQFISNDDVVARMIPFLRRRRSTVTETIR
jgi:cytochrome b561